MEEEKKRKEEYIKKLKELYDKMNQKEEPETAVKGKNKGRKKSLKKRTFTRSYTGSSGIDMEKERSDHTLLIKKEDILKELFDSQYLIDLNNDEYYGKIESSKCEINSNVTLELDIIVPPKDKVNVTINMDEKISSIDVPHENRINVKRRSTRKRPNSNNHSKELVKNRSNLDLENLIEMTGTKIQKKESKELSIKEFSDKEYSIKDTQTQRLVLIDNDEENEDEQRTHREKEKIYKTDKSRKMTSKKHTGVKKK